MKKTFAYFGTMWAICLAVFNLICFLTPRYIGNQDKFAGSFWVGYAFITIAFIGQLFCAKTAFNAEHLQKVFYKLPLLKISYIGLYVMLALGSLVMLIPGLPKWIGAIICILVLFFSVISVLKATVAAEAVNDVDVKVKAQTQFIKLLTVEAENLVARAKTSDDKEACKRVFEAFRFSDPMSTDALSDIENDISMKMRVFTDLVQYGGDTKACADELVALIGDRSRMCKALK